MPGSPKRRAKREAEAAYRVQLPAVIPPPEEPKDRWGRTGKATKFKPEYVEQARVMCEEGATNPELAAAFEVSVSTIYQWRYQHPEFNAVLTIGKRSADDRVERSLYELATGFTITATEIFKLRDKDGNEMLVEREKTIVVPPNPLMVQYWLNNRDPDRWRQRSEKHITGGVEHVHVTLEQATERVKARLAELRQRQLG